MLRCCGYCLQFLQQQLDALVLGGGVGGHQPVCFPLRWKGMPVSLVRPLLPLLPPSDWTRKCSGCSGGGEWSCILHKLHGNLVIKTRNM